MLLVLDRLTVVCAAACRDVYMIMHFCNPLPQLPGYKVEIGLHCTSVLNFKTFDMFIRRRKQGVTDYLTLRIQVLCIIRDLLDDTFPAFAFYSVCCKVR